MTVVRTLHALCRAWKKVAFSDAMEQCDPIRMLGRVDVKMMATSKVVCRLVVDLGYIMNHGIYDPVYLDTQAGGWIGSLEQTQHKARKKAVVA